MLRRGHGGAYDLRPGTADSGGKENHTSIGRPQAYALCSVAVDLKVSQVVDVPNVLISAFLPIDIFE